MKTHATFPDGKNFERISQEIGRFVKQDLTQSTAKNDAEHAVKQQVVQLFDAQESGPALDPVAAQKNKLNEGDQIHQTVPAHGERADRESDGVELWVKKHRRRRVG